MTAPEIELLAQTIPTEALEGVAIRRLGIDPDIVKDLRTKHREDVTALKRGLLERWANMNPGKNQGKVSVHACSGQNTQVRVLEALASFQ